MHPGAELNFQDVWFNLKKWLVLYVFRVVYYWSSMEF
jgi:hypothetical protein